MSADTALKRFSAMNIGSPWRGLNVAPDVTIPAGERAAVMFLYGADAGVTPPTPPAGVTTSTFQGFGGGFLGPHYKRRRKEWKCAEPITTTRFDKSLNRVLIETIKFPVYTPPPDREPTPSLYRAKMTPALRTLLVEDPAIAKKRRADAAAEEARQKRLKRLRADDEFIMMALYGNKDASAKRKPFSMVQDIARAKPEKAAKLMADYIASVKERRKQRAKVTVKTIERDGDGKVVRMRKMTQ